MLRRKVTIQRNPFLIFRRLPMRQFHKSQKMDVIFVGLKNNIFYKSLIISIICFTYSLNSYVVMILLGLYSWDSGCYY